MRVGVSSWVSSIGICPFIGCLPRHWVHLGPEYTPVISSSGALTGEMKAGTRKNTVPRKNKVRFLKLFDAERFGTSISAIICKLCQGQMMHYVGVGCS